MYDGKTRKGQTRYLLEYQYVQDRGGYGPDAGYMAEVQGIGNMKVVKVRGKTSGLGGRGALCRSSLGS